MILCSWTLKEQVAIGSDKQLEFILFLNDLMGHPFNAVISSQSIAERKPRSEQVKNELKTKLSLVDRYHDDLKVLNDNTNAGLSPYQFPELFESVSKFSDTVVSQLKEKISEQSGKRLSEIESQNSADRNNTIKSLDLFLQSPRIPTDKFSIKVTWQSGTYVAISTYYVSGASEVVGGKRGRLSKQEVKVREDNSIEYSFSLNAAEEELFSKPLSFSSFSKGYKMPVKHAVSWISKEAQVDYEKMDRYDLSEAVLTESNLFIVFKDQDKGSEVKFTKSMLAGNKSVDIDYKDSVQSVNVTGQPVLQKNLEMSVVSGLVESIEGALRNIESRRNGLRSLTVNGEDILSTLDAVKFAVAITKLAMVKFGLSLENIESTSFVAKLVDNGLTRAAISERMKSLGPQAEKLSRLPVFHYGK
jgi:hypothetical protein